MATSAPDDAGAETYDRFDWQCAMATADMLAFYLDRVASSSTLDDETTFEMLCEHHEDWALIDGVDSEIVSAKHLEPTFGTFTTIKQLLDEGGVLHLYDRWSALQKSPRCRLVTSAVQTGDAAALLRACDYFAGQGSGALDLGEFEDILGKLAREITKRRFTKAKAADPDVSQESFPQGPAETLASFLRVLRIDRHPYRDDLRGSESRKYALPVATALGRPDAADAIWQALFDVVRERMRAAGPTPRASLPLVLGAKDELGFEARQLTLSEIRTIVAVALANPAGYRPLPKRIKTTKVAVKMSVGGCSDNAIARAENLRLQFRRHMRDVTSGPSQAAAQQKIENILQRIAEEQTDLVRDGAAQWGPQLWTSLQTRLDDLEGSPKARGLDSDLLMGAIAELANNCHVWFSPDFDADEFSRQLAEEATQ